MLLGNTPCELFGCGIKRGSRVVVRKLGVLTLIEGVENFLCIRFKVYRFLLDHDIFGVVMNGLKGSHIGLKVDYRN